MSTRALAAVTALVAAVGLVVSGWALWDWQRTETSLDTTPTTAVRTAEEPAPSSPTPDRTVVTGPATPDPSAGRVPPRPVRVEIGGVGLEMPVRPVGVARDGQMALPADPAVLGWYRFGPAPGAGAGSAVLAGHLDSVREGIGPLVRLRDVTPGDRVEIAAAAGRTRAYEVVAVQRFDRQALPAELFGRTGPEQVRIITCGGEYVPGQGYEQNLVVTARPL